MNIYRLATRILTLSYAYLCDRSGFKGVPRTLSSKWPQLVLVKVVILRLSDLRNKEAEPRGRTHTKKRPSGATTNAHSYKTMISAALLRI